MTEELCKFSVRLLMVIPAHLILLANFFCSSHNSILHNTPAFKNPNVKCKTIAFRVNIMYAACSAKYKGNRTSSK